MQALAITEHASLSISFASGSTGSGIIATLSLTTQSAANILTEDTQVLQVLATEVQNLFTKKGKKAKSSSKADKHAGHSHTAAKGRKASKSSPKADKHASHNHTAAKGGKATKHSTNAGKHASLKKKKEKKGKALKLPHAWKKQTGTAGKHHRGNGAGMSASLGVMALFIAVGAVIKYRRSQQRNGFDVIEEEPAEPAKESTPLLA